MSTLHNYTLSLLTLSLLLSLTTSKSTPHPDTLPLLTFKSTSQNSIKLSSWNTTTQPTPNPCVNWTGVSCLNNRVSHLVLEGLNLTGDIKPLTSLTHLRVLSLKGNSFSGLLPNLSNLTALKFLFLSHNGFNGDFPVDIPVKLVRLDLGFNEFSGGLPLVSVVNRLTRLLTLRLEGNRFNGSILGLDLPGLQDFNVSGNGFSGKIPDSLSRFPVSSFGGNVNLCGAPLKVNCKGIETDPARPGSGGAIASPVKQPSTIVASSPSTLPATALSPIKPEKSSVDHKSSTSKISTIALIAIIVGDALVLVIVSLLLYCYFWRHCKEDRKIKSKQLTESEKIIYSSSPYTNQQGFERGRMVFFDGVVKRFELEDLLRASAEMLGKGGFGTAYKAVLDDGSVVAVKRLKDALVGGGKREFEQQMEVLGKMRHPNLVGLKAYYFSREEKLLVYDYMPNGSLFWLLHGNRGPGRTPLDWNTRLKIAAGAAHGLAFIHNTCKSLKLTHGNIKSTNILLDNTFNARVSDFGLSSFATPPASALKSNGYRAPELSSSSDSLKLTQKSDVYAFGVLLLEILTGKCPSVVESNGFGGPGLGYGGAIDLPRWVQSVVREEWTAEVFDLELMRYKDIEEEMVGLLQIAMTCTAASPDQRPKIGQVVKMIDEIRGVEMSPGHETSDSISESPSLSEDTGGAMSH
ncbi:hypothetical protein ACFE04_029232 [Oxalis oulophora]